MTTWNKKYRNLGGTYQDKVKILLALYMQRTIVDPFTECHIWQGAKDRHGYGSLTHQVKRYQAHKIFYVLFRGEIPPKWELHHTCHNGHNCCVNPFHMEAMSKSRHTRITWAMRRLKE
jgi:hypothetical protein